MLSRIFKKEPKVEFISLLPSLIDIAPILKAEEVIPSLIKNASKAYSEDRKNPDYGSYNYSTTAKCPGIKRYYKYGWILTAWQDIKITTNGDGVSFEWATPIDQSVLHTNNVVVGPMVTAHQKEQYFDLIGGTKDSIATVVKINTPWRCKIPEGYYLMETSVPYSDEKRFTTVPGMLSASDGMPPLNVQLIWHVTNGTSVIKAGTPIAHYVLVPINQCKEEIREATGKEIKNLITEEAIIGRRFVSNLNERKCMFAKLYRGK